MGAKATEVLKSFAVSSLGMGEDGVAPLFEGDDLADGALDALNGKLAEKVATFTANEAAAKRERDEAKELLKQQKMRDKKEVLTELEAELRKEHNYDDLTKRGKELVDAIVAKAKKEASAIDEGKLNLHPTVIALQDQIAKIPELVQAARQEEVARHQGEQDTRDVREYAGTLFDAWDPAYETEDPTIRATRRSDFLDLIRNVPTKVTRDGSGKVTDVLPLNQDKSDRLKDNLGNAISIKTLVEGLAAQRFIRRAAEDRGTAPDPNKVGSGSGGSSGKYPASMTRAEKLKAEDVIMSLKTKEERESAMVALKKVALSD